MTGEQVFVVIAVVAILAIALDIAGDGCITRLWAWFRGSGNMDD